ncbi:hypothetical protein IE81DRAFT_13569 [Ceraceosorus guamensis]|uniref:Uncharacterized protein n=1 Tax=Ceraceosorus guamensis TaxID=1522189 RepID=A0A316VQ71_9BASI|nr:hypothetical protein IE81DRAFT_13569 [Ceraceosorus guamensis]PWN39672.1 hypothetical protein IE81DRAFT_13569 [Ceraceosorus guamensis]
MSSEGRPIASITPPVSIYVTALLEFVAEHVLNNVGRIIERDNSDEAGLMDLRKALEEDESCASWWDRMTTRVEMQSKEREEGESRRGSARPWQVPDESELEEAAGRRKFVRQSLNLSSTGVPISPSFPSTPRVAGQGHGRESSQPYSASAHGHNDRDFGAQSPASTSLTHGSSLPGSATAFNSAVGSTNHSVETAATSTGPTLTRRSSSDRGWGNLLQGRRRGSFRSSQDMAAPKPSISQTSDGANPEIVEPDDFEALMMSGQTMKVSLTPNRLRTIEVAKQDAEAKKNARKRPGVMNLGVRDDGGSSTPLSARSATSPAPPLSARSAAEGAPLEDQLLAAAGVSGRERSASRASSIRASNSSRSNLTPKTGSQPPSAYRGPPEAGKPSEQNGRSASVDYGTVDDEYVPGSVGGSRRGSSAKGALQPRNEGTTSSVRDMVDMFNGTPPSPLTQGQFDSPASGRESRQSVISLSSNTGDGRKGALSGRVRSLFGGRKPSASGIVTPQPRRLHSGNSSRNGSFANMPNASEDNIASSSVGHASVASISEFQQPQSRTVGGSLGRSHSNRPPSAGGRVPVPAYRDGDEGRLSPAIESTTPDPPVKTPDATEALPDLPLKDESVNAGVADLSRSTTDSGGLVGIYPEEPLLRRAATPPSPPPAQGQQARAEPPSRKIPWSYARQSSIGPSNAAIGASIRRPGSSAAAERNAAAAAAAAGTAGSVGGHSSSNEHAPPSAWAYSAGGTVDEHAVGNKTPTANHAAGYAQSPSTRSSMGPARTSSTTSRSETARVLATLDRRMRDCNTVEECRMLVSQSLALAAAAMHATGGESRQVQDIPDEDVVAGDAQHPRSATLQPALPAAAAAAALKTEASPAEVAVATIDAPRALLPILAMAEGYDAYADESTPAFKQSANLAAWLLDGDGDDYFHSLPQQYAESNTLDSSPASKDSSHAADLEDDFSSAKSDEEQEEHEVDADADAEDTEEEARTVQRQAPPASASASGSGYRRSAASELANVASDATLRWTSASSGSGTKNARSPTNGHLPGSYASQTPLLSRSKAAAPPPPPPQPNMHATKVMPSNTTDGELAEMQARRTSMHSSTKSFRDASEEPVD